MRFDFATEQDALDFNALAYDMVGVAGEVVEGTDLQFDVILDSELAQSLNALYSDVASGMLEKS